MHSCDFTRECTSSSLKSQPCCQYLGSLFFFPFVQFIQPSILSVFPLSFGSSLPSAKNCTISLNANKPEQGVSAIGNPIQNENIRGGKLIGRTSGDTVGS
uniref:Uncharacterized protein n=1 Tax=Sphaerodactylus townsendi TaxID=933632 RepID=A0ACB8E704_9SAUR